MKQYLDTVRAVRASNNFRPDRTKTGTQSIFAPQMRFDLAQGFPLTTTKKTFWKGILRELLWILEGSTDNRRLNELGTTIWDEWATDDGALGPVYGAQWRRWSTYRWVEETQAKPFGQLWQEAIERKDFYLASLLSRVAEQMVQRDVALTDFNPPEESVLGAALKAAGIELTETVSYLKEESVDQIAELIDNLRTRPFSRRHVISAWNVADLADERLGPQQNVAQGKMALSPCHCLFQFYVEYRSLDDVRAEAGQELNEAFGKEFADTTWDVTDGDWKKTIALYERYYAFYEQRGIKTKRLSCQLYQRSADFMVGVPFNVASYALLTLMIAQVVGMVPGEFVWTGGDTHIYIPHFAGADEQLSRTPHRLPRMWINPDVKNIDDFQESDFRLEGYEHDEPIEYDIAV